MKRLRIIVLLALLAAGPGAAPAAEEVFDRIEQALTTSAFDGHCGKPPAFPDCSLMM